MVDLSPRRRLTGTLFGGAALGSTAYIAALTVSTLAVEEIAGSATLAGLPSSAAILGTALGTTLLTMHVARRGRRPGLLRGYALGTLGALLAIVAVTTGSFPFLIVGMAVLGLGNASNHLARYTAAEMHPPETRASALSVVVWAGTIGSVIGPSLLQPSGRMTEALGISELAGGYLVASVFMLAALIGYLVALRPDPASLAFREQEVETEGVVRLGEAFRLPQVRVALAAMIAGQVAMVMIMTATPLHIHHHGSDLGIVGLVMSSHTLGMFALSPLTGRLADRWGRFRVVAAGLGVTGVAAVLAASDLEASTGLLVGSLFLLGMGWNFCFVAGSSLLTGGVPRSIRAKLQGRVDSLTWTASATSSLVSGILFELRDYRLVALLGLALLAVPTLVVIRNRRDVATVPA